MGCAHVPGLARAAGFAELTSARLSPRSLLEKECSENHAVTPLLIRAEPPEIPLADDGAVHRVRVVLG